MDRLDLIISGGRGSRMRVYLLDGLDLGPGQPAKSDNISNCP